MSTAAIDYFISDKIVAIKLNSGKEIAISLKNLRKACPCAHCSGEKDIFGNIYIGAKTVFTEDSIKLIKISLVGKYAIRFFWKDGHANGIYPFELLEALGE